MEGPQDGEKKARKKSSLSMWDIVLGIGAETLSSLAFVAFLCFLGFVVLVLVR